MPIFICLLRAVNVGGTGKLPMSDLKAMCEAEGFQDVKTYIASGNVVFKSAKTKKQVEQALEQQLETYAGKAVEVIVRTPSEMSQIVRKNPYQDAKPNQVLVFFFKQTCPKNSLESIKGQKDEEITKSKAELYVHFPSGQGKSKLLIPATKTATSRNMNTVNKLIEIAASL